MRQMVGASPAAHQLWYRYLQHLIAAAPVAPVAPPVWHVPCATGPVPWPRLQVQYSLLDRRPENGMSEYCQRHGITLLPYGVLAGGFLTDKYLGVSSAAASKARSA